MYKYPGNTKEIISENDSSSCATKAKGFESGVEDYLLRKQESKKRRRRVCFNGVSAEPVDEWPAAGI